MPSLLELPPDYEWRPLTVTDATEVTGVVAAAELVDIGEVLVEDGEVAADWGRPSFELGRDAVAVARSSGGELVAVGQLSGPRADACVHPEHRGRGLGSALLSWTETHARERGETLVGQTVRVPSSGLDLLTARGYRPRYDSWLLRADLQTVTEHEPRRAADGVRVRVMRDGEQQTAYRVGEDAFGSWPHRRPLEYGDWEATVLQREGFAPWRMLLAVEPLGSGARGAQQVVGVCHLDLVGDQLWIEQLAVRADRRGRGIGRLLLREAGLAGGVRGARTVDLNTDSRTGALGWYEALGLRARLTFRHLALGVGTTDR